MMMKRVRGGVRREDRDDLGHRAPFSLLPLRFGRSRR
jgi:hypothetical protein